MRASTPHPVAQALKVKPFKRYACRITNQEHPPRQLLIGLDAVEWTLVRKWADAGKLPTFRRLLQQGAHAELVSTAAQLPDTVWSVIYSGQNPGRFAKYFYVQYDSATGG